MGRGWPDVPAVEARRWDENDAAVAAVVVGVDDGTLPLRGDAWCDASSSIRPLASSSIAWNDNRLEALALAPTLTGVSVNPKRSER